MKSFDEIQKRWLRNPKYRAAFNALEEEYTLVEAMIVARAEAGLTQAQLAKKMKTTQSVIARMETGRGIPSTSTLKRLAAATGTKLKITFEPIGKRGRT